MNIYLDINNVILTKELKPAKHLKEFLTKIFGKGDVYWLSSRCRGDCKEVNNYLSRYFDDDLMKLVKKIKPTKWKTMKTEAIDFSKPFLWYDDFILDAEKKVLKKRGKMNCWVRVDVNKEEGNLRDLIY